VDRKKIIVVALTVELSCFAFLAWYAGTGPTSIVPIFLNVMVYGTARAFLAPAQRSLGPSIAPPFALSRVIAFNSSTWQIASIVAPALGGILYATGRTLPFAVAAGIVATAIVVIATMHVPAVRRTTVDEQVRPSFGSAVAGLRLIRREPILFGAISLDLFAVLFGGAVALIPAIATDRLGVDASGQGYLRAAGGAGAALCAITLAVRPFGRHVGRWLFVSVAVFGAATVALGATRTFWVAMAAMAVLSCADMISVYVRSTLVPLATPEDTRGRVLAVEQVFIGASNELGAFQSGVAATLLGVPLAVMGGGVATIVVVALWWRFFPQLRDVDRFTDLEQK
jgi:MFS family permease